VDVIPAPWNLTRALMEYNRMLGFSISRPIVRFRGLEEAGHLPKNAEGEAEPSLLEIVRTQINFKLYTLDPKLIQLPIDVSYLHHGFNHVGAFFKFGSLRSAGFSTNSILNQPGAAKEIMRRGHRRKYFLLWLFYLLVYMSISGYCKFCGKSLQSF
jgi:hypothetical protein